MGQSHAMENRFTEADVERAISEIRLGA